MPAWVLVTCKKLFRKIFRIYSPVLPSAAPDSGWIQIFAFLVFVIFLFPININRVATQYVYERKMICFWPEPGDPERIRRREILAITQD